MSVFSNHTGACLFLFCWLYCEKMLSLMSAMPDFYIRSGFWLNTISNLTLSAEAILLEIYDHIEYNYTVTLRSELSHPLSQSLLNVRKIYKYQTLMEVLCSFFFCWAEGARGEETPLRRILLRGWVEREEKVSACSCFSAHSFLWKVKIDFKLWFLKKSIISGVKETIADLIVVHLNNVICHVCNIQCRASVSASQLLWVYILHD